MARHIGQLKLGSKPAIYNQSFHLIGASCSNLNEYIEHKTAIVDHQIKNIVNNIFSISTSFSVLVTLYQFFSFSQ